VYLATLNIAGFKNFEAPYEISNFFHFRPVAELGELTFCKGLSVLVGENGVGKSAVVDARRLLLLEDEFGRNLVSEAAFHAQLMTHVRPSLLSNSTRLSMVYLKRKRLCFCRGRIL